MEVRFQSYRDESRRTRPAIPIASDRPVLFDGAEYRLWTYSAARGLILELIQRIDKQEFLESFQVRKEFHQCGLRDRDLRLMLLSFYDS